MPKLENRCTITLKKDDYEPIKTYRVNDRLFYMLEKNLEKYRSVSPKARKIKCVETEQIFDSARKASEWVAFVKENYYCSSDQIKQCCRGKQKTSYGYHWEFVN